MPDEDVLKMQRKAAMDLEREIFSVVAVRSITHNLPPDMVAQVLFMGIGEIAATFRSVEMKEDARGNTLLEHIKALAPEYIDIGYNSYMDSSFEESRNEVPR